MPSPLKRLAVLACAAALLGVAATTALATSSAAPPKPVRTITKTYSAGQCDSAYVCWTCTGPVDLDQVTVTVDTNLAAVEAVRLAAGCTGRIGKLTVVTQSADGVKVASGAHDLDVGGGTIVCTNRFGAVHQDGIQVMGGQHITFTGVTVSCATANHSSFFVNQGNSSDEVPTDVVFTRGTLGSTGTTVALGTSKRSGVSQSTVCPSTKIGVAISIPDEPSGDGPTAVKPVDRKNIFPAVC